MTLIDYRVLVSAPPEIIWELLSDLAATPKWHVNCTQASILTTQQEGAGIRCRLTIDNGPDLVLEIQSWYKNLGYEYTVVDGPFRESKGRIRLHTIPEGTTVQWTFEYELAGFAAGMRDLTTRRRLQNEVEASLKRLKKLVESTGVRMDAETRERVSMRPAPTAKQRAVLSENIARTQPAMKPVTPESDEPAPAYDRAVIDEGDLPDIPEPLVIGEDDLPPTPGDEIQSVLAAAEPPMEDEDTRPNPATTPEDATLPSRPTEEFVLEAEAANAIASEPQSPSESLENEPAAAQAEPDADQPEPEPAALPVESLAATVQVEAVRSSEAETIAEPLEPVAVDSTEPELPAIEPGEVTPTEAHIEPKPTPELVADPEPEPIPNIPASPLQVQEIKPVGPSIWEVFGMAPPSAEATPDSVPDPEPEAVETTTAPVPAERALRPRLRLAHPGYRASARQITRRR